MPWTAVVRLFTAHARLAREEQLRMAEAVRLGSLADAQTWDRFASAAMGVESEWDRMHAINERALARAAAAALAGDDSSRTESDA
jgi:hypothetical protein